MALRLIWAYKPLAALDNRTGIVEVEDELAAPLIASGDVQDWFACGALDLKTIEETPPPAPPPAPKAGRRAAS